MYSRNGRGRSGGLSSGLRSLDSFSLASSTLDSLISQDQKELNDIEFKKYIEDFDTAETLYRKAVGANYTGPAPASSGFGGFGGFASAFATVPKNAPPVEHRKFKLKQRYDKAYEGRKRQIIQRSRNDPRFQVMNNTEEMMEFYRNLEAPPPDITPPLPPPPPEPEPVRVRNNRGLFELRGTRKYAEKNARERAELQRERQAMMQTIENPRRWSRSYNPFVPKSEGGDAPERDEGPSGV